MTKLLVLPAKPRNKKEEDLLEDIITDPNLENSGLKNRVIKHIKDKYSLVTWHHYPATITKYSFEDVKSAQVTHNSYNGRPPTPKIIGIRNYRDFLPAH